MENIYGSMLTFSFDGLCVAWTYFVELGCDGLHMSHAL